MSYQIVIIEGRLGKDVESRVTTGGTTVASFSVAVDNPPKNGEKVAPEWFNVKAFGKTAEVAEEYLSKGRSVLIQGRLQTEEWEDKEGNQRRTVVLICDRLSFVGPKPDDERDEPKREPGRQPRRQEQSEEPQPRKSQPTRAAKQQPPADEEPMPWD